MEPEEKPVVTPPVLAQACAADRQQNSGPSLKFPTDFKREELLLVCCSF